MFTIEPITCSKMFTGVNGTEFSEWLTREIETRGLSQAELAYKAGVSAATISHVLSGARNAGADLCVAIAKALGYSPEYVFRIAGLLPTEDDAPRPPGLLELIEIFQNATPAEQDELIEFARFKVLRAREERERAKNRRHRPATG